MKLEIDLNKLSIEELETVLKLAKKDEHIERETKVLTPEFKQRVKRAFHHRVKKRDLMGEFEARKEEIIGIISKKKKGIKMAHLLKKMKLYHSGTTANPMKVFLAQQKRIVQEGRFFKLELKENEGRSNFSQELTYPELKKQDGRALRARFIINRANGLMYADKGMSREKAFVIAASEWKNHKSDKIKSSKFNWEGLSEKGEQIRDMLNQRFRDKKSINHNEFNIIGLSESLVPLVLYRIMKEQVDILADLNLKGKIVLKNGVLSFEGGN